MFSLTSSNELLGQSFANTLKHSNVWQSLYKPFYLTLRRFNWVIFICNSSKSVLSCACLIVRPIKPFLNINDQTLYRLYWHVTQWWEAFVFLVYDCRLTLSGLIVAQMFCPKQQLMGFWPKGSSSLDRYFQEEKVARDAANL